jgi:hypothetical protein
MYTYLIEKWNYQKLWFSNHTLQDKN